MVEPLNRQRVLNFVDTFSAGDIEGALSCCENELNTKYGSGFSIQPKFSQSAYFRFHNKSEVYDGLYFVGAGTHPGAGVPGVLSSAKVLDKIL